MTMEAGPLDAGHWQKMTIVRGGKEYPGYWGQSDDEQAEALLTVTVALEGARNSAQLGGQPTEFANRLARQLLNELIDGVAARAMTS